MQVVRVSSTAIGGSRAHGISLESSVAKVHDTEFQAQAGDQNYGMLIYNSPAATTAITESVAAAQGGSSSRGMVIENASVNLSGVIASGSGASSQNHGLYTALADSALSIVIDHCRLAGSTYSVFDNDADYNFCAGAPKLDGPVATTGKWSCAFRYDGDNLALGADCQ